MVFSLFGYAHFFQPQMFCFFRGPLLPHFIFCFHSAPLRISSGIALKIFTVYVLSMSASVNSTGDPTFIGHDNIVDLEYTLGYQKFLHGLGVQEVALKIQWAHLGICGHFLGICHVLPLKTHEPRVMPFIIFFYLLYGIIQKCYQTQRSKNITDTPLGPALEIILIMHVMIWTFCIQ